MPAGDVAPFHRFARAYDLVMPGADAASLKRGLARAEGPVERVLDVGGGSGRGSRALSVDERLVVDAARGMLEQARGHGLATVQGDAGRLPFADASVDAVVILDALHHMGDPARVFESVARVLRPGGVLVVREFDPMTLRGRALVLGERVIGFDSQFWPAAECRDLVADAGLAASVVESGFDYTVAGVKRG